MKIPLVILGMVVVTTSALATDMETMICKNGIVSKGDLLVEVVAKCGEPAQKSQREEKLVDQVRAPSGREQTSFRIITVNEWAYNFGPNEFLQNLRFEDGRLVRIESLGYGY